MMSDTRSSLRRGAVIFEALVALSILAITGIAILASIQGARRARSSAYARERTFQDGVSLVDAAMLWSRIELDVRLGRHQQGDWVLEIQRPAATLYQLSLFEGLQSAPTITTYVIR